QLFAAAEHARSDHEVGAPLHNRRNQLGNIAGVVRSVRVDEDDDGMTGGLEASANRVPFPAAGVLHHARIVAASDLDGTVGRSAVNDDQIVAEPLEPLEHTANGF